MSSAGGDWTSWGGEEHSKVDEDDSRGGEENSVLRDKCSGEAETCSDGSEHFHEMGEVISHGQEMTSGLRDALSEQCLISAQTDVYFFRHRNGLPQHAQILLGRLDFFVLCVREVGGLKAWRYP